MAAQEQVADSTAVPAFVQLKQNDPEGDVIYSPPRSTANMTSLSTKDTSALTSGMRTATHGNAPTSVEGTPNISVRVYIYFLPYPLPPDTPVPYSIHLPDKNPLNLPSHQFEPTSTLVLASPKRTFVDIRLYKPFRKDSPSALPNQGEPHRLEWAFAGHSTSIPLPDRDDYEDLSHSTWTHWVDSRFPVASTDIPVDEGDMYPITTDLTLEHGHAFHPALNAVKSHEEMWRDVDAISTSSGSKVCIVLRVHDDAAGVRGVVIRVGQFCQGIVIKGQEVTVERWEWKDGEDKGWKRTARVGDLWVPCKAACREEVMAVGGKVRYGEYEWMVEEVWGWE